MFQKEPDRLFGQARLPDFKIAKVDTEGFRFLAKLVSAHALDIGEVEDRGGETVEHGSAEVVGHVVEACQHRWWPCAPSFPNPRLADGSLGFALPARRTFPARIVVL